MSWDKQVIQENRVLRFKLVILLFNLSFSGGFSWIEELFIAFLSNWINLDQNVENFSA